MCKEMNVRTVGEGIETEEVNSLLASLNCDHAQGYLYSRPIPIPEFEKNTFNKIFNLFKKGGQKLD